MELVEVEEADGRFVERTRGCQKGSGMGLVEVEDADGGFVERTRGVPERKWNGAGRGAVRELLE
jgi:hypothetical protein